MKKVVIAFDSLQHSIDKKRKHLCGSVQFCKLNVVANLSRPSTPYPSRTSQHKLRRLHDCYEVVLAEEPIFGTGLAVSAAYGPNTTKKGNDGGANISIKSLIVHRQHSHSSSDLVCVLYYFRCVV